MSGREGVRLTGDAYKRQVVSRATVNDAMEKFNDCVSNKQSSGKTLEVANSECVNEIAPAAGGKSRKSRRGKSRRGKTRRNKRRSSKRRR